MTTKIEWAQNADGSAGKTWNPVRGCKMISPGCASCYAMKQAGRFSGPGGAYEGLVQLGAKGKGYRWTGDFREVPDMLDEPLRTRKPTTWFVNSMSDLFGEGVSDAFIMRVFDVMEQARKHTFQVLTKRAGRMRAWVEDYMRATSPAGTTTIEIASNIWLGVSCEDKKHGVPRIDELRKVPAAVRFLSIEPLLEDIGEVNLEGIGWVIVGGESGNGARPMHRDWARSIRRQCVAARVPFFFKQWGAWMPDPGTPGHGRPSQLIRPREDQPSDIYVKMGKKNAGRLLDGRTWDEMPARPAEMRHGA